MTNTKMESEIGVMRGIGERVCIRISDGFHQDVHLHQYNGRTSPFFFNYLSRDVLDPQRRQSSSNPHDIIDRLRWLQATRDPRLSD